MAGTGSRRAPGQAATLDAEPSAMLVRTGRRLWDDDDRLAERRTGIGAPSTVRLTGSSPSSSRVVTTVCHAHDDLSAGRRLDGPVAIRRRWTRKPVRARRRI